MAETGTTPVVQTAPRSNLVSGQFINIQKFHVAKLLEDPAGGKAVYDTPVSLGKVLRKIDIKPKTSQAELFADGQSIDTATSTASFDLTFDTTALPLEYAAYLFGHKMENGVMKAEKDQAFLRGGDPHDAEDEGHAGRRDSRSRTQALPQQQCRGPLHE